jgi:hypothetical protein
VVQFVYIDETGSSGKGARNQPLLTLVAAIVPEDKVAPLARRFNELAMSHLGWRPSDFEFHGVELWGGDGYWTGKKPPELIAAYEAAIGVLVELDIAIAHASIDKAKLHTRYSGAADKNVYLLALQFLLEKVNAYGPSDLKVLVADEAKEHELRAVKMVSNLQEWGSGEVPGSPLKRIIDSLHFVDSAASPGVQMADLAAYALQRRRAKRDTHADAIAAIERIAGVVHDQTKTWRWTWPY